MHRARTVLALALIWGADIAGAWLLPDRHQIVLNGIVVALSFAALGRWAERKSQARAQAAVFAADKREAALIRSVERLSAARRTGPIPTLREVA